MYKPGQKVRCIQRPQFYNADYPAPKIGEIYTVEHYQNCVIRIEEDLGGKNDDLSREFEEDIFELVEEKSNDQTQYGDRKNLGKLRWRNVPMFILEPVIEVGALAEKRVDNPKGKYETFNFLKGMRANDTLDSLKRHLNDFESPYKSDTDNESGLSHLAHIAWNALVLLHSLKQYPELDDRWKGNK